MSFSIWTNDTRRDEDKNRSPRAESTAARYESQKPRPAGTSNPGQTRACFTAVQTKDSPACPSVCPYACRSTILHQSACVHAYILYVLLCTLCYVNVNSLSPPAGGTHIRQTETSQPVSAATHEPSI